MATSRHCPQRSMQCPLVVLRAKRSGSLHQAESPAIQHEIRAQSWQVLCNFSAYPSHMHSWANMLFVSCNSALSFRTASLYLSPIESPDLRLPLHLSMLRPCALCCVIAVRPRSNGPTFACLRSLADDCRCVVHLGRHRHGADDIHTGVHST